jgi:tRNA A-37 threonylcarbamoyl transferase component Bud32
VSASVAPGRLVGPDLPALRRLADDGIVAVEDVLRRAEGVRDLEARANYRLWAGGLLVHVKRGKRRFGRRPRAAEAEAIQTARRAGVPTARLLFWGLDPRHGAVTGTLDLAPARPLDALLKEGRVPGTARRRLLVALARAVARLHGAGLHHRDLYLNHVFADPLSDPPRLWLIDLERLGRHRRALSRWVVKDLAALEATARGAGVSGAERRRFLLAYLDARGLGRARAARPLLARIERKARRILAHVPRTPVGAAARRPERIA